VGKLLNVSQFFSGKKTKDAQKKDFGSTSLLLRLTQNALEKVEQDVGSAWAIIPLSYLLDLASTAHLSKLQKFFDLSQKDRAEMAYLISDVLKLRRSLVGGLVNICGLEVSKGSLSRQSFKKAESLLEEFNFLSEQKSWDWVSFHENEYDFFLNLSKAAKVSGYTYFLRKARKHYLNSSLALNKNYWQIPVATEIYKQIYKHILEGDGISARNDILNFYEKNDESILFQYQKEHQTNEAPTGFVYLCR
jgi:DNA-binding FadR family transcriptional regulator